MGLGLAIVKRIINDLNSSISLNLVRAGHNILCCIPHLKEKTNFTY